MAEIDAKAKEMMDAVVKNLKEHEWHFRTRDFHDGECAIDTDIASNSGVFKFYDIRMLFRKWDMQTIYYFPVKVPEEFRTAVGEYLMRVNWRMKYGKFVMNFDDGEIRYEIVFNPHTVLDDVENVLGDSFNMMSETSDEWTPGIMKIIFGGKKAAEVFNEIAEAKNGSKDDPPPEEPPVPPAGAGGSAAGPAGADAKSRGRGRSVRRGKKASRAKKSGAEDAANGAAAYSLSGLNIEGKIPLEQIVKAVKRFRSNDRAAVDAPRLNILLSGAPGSGKTAFAKHLAAEVGAPLRTIRASQIISKWVGETEKQLAGAFDEARANGEILFIDECDSFLQPREGSDHAWEVTQVNELLQQMENFDGVMIAATNFSDRLDKAVLRRFTYKLKLDYLTNDGKRIFFDRYFKTPLTEDETARLDSIAKLTPGDFRTVREELYYLDDRQTNDARLSALEAESEAKGKETARIGF